MREQRASRPPMYLVPNDRPSHVPASRRPGIPTYPNALVGRASELEGLNELVSKQRLITIRGPGGMGKTRLVSEWAARSAAEIAFVSLASLVSTEHIAPALAVALGLTIDPKSDPTDDVLRSLKLRETILVFDNLEHLLSDARVTTLLQTILDRCKAVRLVVTSRERIGLGAEHVLDLGGLGVSSEAVELFEARARQVQSNFEADGARADVLEICRILEGVPLGIELAATWVRVLGTGEILVEMKKALDFLTADPRSGRDPRQSSMRAVFAQSWRLLSEEEQQVLARLSVFRGGFDRVAATQVAKATLPLLATLIDRSLVRVRSSGRTTRYDMHELLRQFAAEQLSKEEDLALAHAEFFVELAVTTHPRLRGEAQEQSMADLTADLDNLRAALELTHARGRYDLAARIGWALWPFWWIRNMQREGRRFMEMLMPHVGGLDLFWKTQATIAMGAMLYAQGDVEGCVRYSKDLLELSAQTPSGDPRALAFAHGGFGLGAIAKGDPKEAIVQLTKSRELFLVAGDAGIASQSAAWIGTVQLLAGNLEAARTAATAGLNEALGAGDRLANTTARYCLARIALAAGDLEEATTHLLESIPPSLAIEDRGSLSYIFELLGIVAAKKGNVSSAASLFGASDAILEAIGNRGHTYYLPDTKGIAAARASVVDDEAYRLGKEKTIEELVALVRNAPAPSPGQTPSATVKVEYFAEDDSVFVDRDYIIKGVAGRLLWKMLRANETEGRTEFSNRELRLDTTLNLPKYKDNLESRLSLLAKRLTEKTLPFRLESIARGKIRLVIDKPLALTEKN